MKSFTSGLYVTEKEGEIPCILIKTLFFIHHDVKNVSKDFRISELMRLYGYALDKDKGVISVNTFF